MSGSRRLGAAAVASLLAWMPACDRAAGFEPAHRVGRVPPDAAVAPAASDAPSRPGGAWIRFTDVTHGSGLEKFHLHAGREPPKDWVVETIGGGLAVADFDGDGDMDVFLADGADLSRTGEIVRPDCSGCALFRNDGDFRFADATAASGAGLRGYWLGAAAADYDGDGDWDLCVVGYDVRALLRNRGDGSFDDVTTAAGLSPRRWEDSSACAWADVDGDGLLDLFVANYSDQRAIAGILLAQFPDPRQCARFGHRTFCGPNGLPAQANRLYLQRPDHTFADASDRISEPVGPSFQPVFCDFDDDGDLDCYVPNDGVENTLLVNDGAGRLTDAALVAGVAGNRTHFPQASMGVAVADVDGDLRPDIAVTNFAGEYNALYRQRGRAAGTPRFEDVTSRSRFSDMCQDRVCWGVGLVDFDQDSRLDAFVAAGNVFGRTELGDRSDVAVAQRSQVLRGLGPPDARFEDVSARSGCHFEDARLWRGAVFPDLDDDGDADVVLTAQHSAPAVLRNDGGERNGWIRFDLRPRPGLPTPAGARVTVTLADGGRRRADLHCGSSHESSDDPRLHFGLGAACVVPAAEVRWPDGTVTRLRDLPACRVVVVRQDE